MCVYSPLYTCVQLTEKSLNY